jgi:Tol biopolymer transport system component
VRAATPLAIAILLAGWLRGSEQETARKKLVTVPQRDQLARSHDPRTARVSAGGRHVVFASYARLVPEDTNSRRDVYVLDLATRQLTIESPGLRGASADGESFSPDISADGRYVVFVSVAGNLTALPLTQGIRRLFLRDRQARTTRPLSMGTDGAPPHRPSGNPAISADGTTVVFESSATDPIDRGEGTGNTVGLYLNRVSSDVGSRLDVASTGQIRPGLSVSPAISADGRYVAFMSRADLTCIERPACHSEPGDRNGVADIYLRDTMTGTTTRVSRGHKEQDSNGPSYSPSISGDGRLVAFISEASNLTPGGGKPVAQVYVRDVVAGVTELVSRDPRGRPVRGKSAHPTISLDGSIVAFQTLASNLLCDRQCLPGQRDMNLLWDVLAYDRRARCFVRASADGPEEWMESSRGASLDASGSVIAFMSRHPVDELDEGDDEDLYVATTPKCDGDRRHLNHLRDLIQVEPAKESPLDNLRVSRVVFGPRPSFAAAVSTETVAAPSVTLRPAAGDVHQDVPHQLRRYHVAPADQTDKRFEGGPT